VLRVGYSSLKDVRGVERTIHSIDKVSLCHVGGHSCGHDCTHPRDVEGNVRKKESQVILIISGTGHNEMISVSLGPARGRGQDGSDIAKLIGGGRPESREVAEGSDERTGDPEIIEREDVDKGG